MSFYFSLYIFTSSILSLMIIRKHILLCLISLELIVLSLLLQILFYCLMFNYSFYMYLFMMTFYVCEGVLGLSVLVYMIRSHGNDYINSLLTW
uniref:NADH-ubiquinone oxidoreductase chain 4L n=2 Tax=Cicadellidae TaxID=30102 RepID=A0A7T1C515_9HEMI|nr:NADH dehydrogenase subunit 4L [Mitjaevia protuberanta]YP_010117071.1 NADH dehydrogenase subunit 4L [Gunungidia aurantiifasciata]QJA16316.1 NADH dehydrogenase subunit 4L [Mitjaevia protuberanta]QPM99285.1 NADH dehydrogenase subunit 4L [Gunungidia aurantiifasciata]